MKLKHIPILAILFVTLLAFTACSKKDREPTLIVIVKDSNSELIEGAQVHVWPTDQLTVDSTSSGVVDSSMNKYSYTDAFGKATFCFPASAVLDVDVTYKQLKGHKVVKIETVRQKDEENIFEETVYIE